MIGALLTALLMAREAEQAVKELQQNAYLLDMAEHDAALF